MSIKKIETDIEHPFIKSDKISVSGFTYTMENDVVKYVRPFVRTLGKFTIDIQKNKIYKTPFGETDVLTKTNLVVDKVFNKLLVDTTINYIESLSNFSISIALKMNPDIDIETIYKFILDKLKTI